MADALQVINKLSDTLEIEKVNIEPPYMSKPRYRRFLIEGSVTGLVNIEVLVKNLDRIQSCVVDPSLSTKKRFQ